MSVYSMRKKIGYIAGPAVFLVVYFLPMHLGVAAHRLLALFSLVIVFWLFETIPIGITALLGAALMVPLGITNAKGAFCAFANPIVMLFLGSFVLADAMIKHRLHRRIALSILSVKWVTSSTLGLVAGIAITPYFLSMWMSNTATTAMMLPITLGILNMIPEGRGKGMSSHTTLLLVIAFAASIGGIATPVGTPPNLIALGFLKKIGYDIGFFQWMSFALPISLVTLLVLIIYMYIVMNKPEIKGGALHKLVYEEKQKLGGLSKGERNTLIIFAIVVVLWILPGFFRTIGKMGHLKSFLEIHAIFHRYLNEKVVAILGAGLLFVVPVDWGKWEFTLDIGALKRIDWSTLLLFGGGLSLGEQVFKTGLARSIGSVLQGFMVKNSLFASVLIVVVALIIFTEITSNTATANTFIPIIIGISQITGLNLLPLVIGGTLGASYAFMLPVATPPNAIIYGSGEVPLDKMVKTGIVLDVIGSVIIAVFIIFMVK